LLKKTTTIMALLALLLVASPALAGPGNANFLLGQRSLDTGEDDTEDIEEQPVFGVSVDFNPSDWPISWVIGFYVSSEEEDFDFGGGFEGTATASLAELSFGVLKGWEVGGGNTRPFVGGGLTAVSVTLELEFDPSGLPDIDEDDTSPALYGEGGVYWRVGSAFNIGVGGRIVLGTDFDIEGESFEADYIQGGLILGWGWD
jgi:hypothetical protein